MKNKITLFMKKLIANLLCMVTLVGIFTPTTVAYAAPTYTTHSPLLSGDTMAIDEINPWELTCFGIFMSNFCVPFVDSYVSAFSQTAPTGSKGAGLAALTFTTGGDISADSNVRRMVNFVMDSLVKQYQPLVVKSFALKNGAWQAKDTAINMTTSDEKDSLIRRATLADLLPVISGLFENSKQDFDYDFNATQVWDHAWLAGSSDYSVSSGELPGAPLEDFHITHGVLSKFYISNDGLTITEEIPVFDMTDAWDVQIPSQCLLYGAYKDDGHYLSDVLKLVNNAQNIPIVMDRVGNICALDESTGSLIVIIPAYLNKHLTVDNTINLVGSTILNTVANTEDKMAVASSVSGVRAVNNDAKADVKIETMLNAGIGSVIHSKNDISAGKSFLYNVASDYNTKKNSTRITNACYKNFLDSGLDTKNHLRWSTIIYHDADSDKGLDVQNYCIAKKDSDKAADAFIIYDSSTSKYRLNSSYTFSLSSSLNRVASSIGNPKMDPSGSVSNKDNIYSYLSVFQTAAQLYTAIASINTEGTIKSYYCSLESGNSKQNQLFAGLNGNTSGQDSKQELVYVPIGADYSFGTHKDHGWYDVNLMPGIFADSKDLTAAGILKVSKQACMLTVDMYHGKAYGLPTDARVTLGNAIADGFNFDYTELAVAGEDLFEITNPLYILSKNGSNVITIGTEQTSAYNALLTKKLGTTMYLDYDTYSKGGTTSYAHYNNDLVKNWARIVLATPTLQVASSYLGLRQDYIFSTYASDMYYTYLDIYGFLGTKHKFREELYILLGNECATLTSEEMAEKIMTQGLTAEQKEQLLKDNAYLMLSTSEDGREYRSRMVSGMIEEWLIDNYDKTCYGDTESEYFQTLTSTSKSFVNLPTYAENWLTEWVVAHWTTVMPLLLIFLFIIVIAFGTLNGKKPAWILANLLLTTCMLVLLPGAAEIAPYLVEKVSDSAFKDVIGTMAISEAVEDETIMADIDKQYKGYSEEIKDAVKSVSALGTSGSLMLKQDMTRKVISANTNTTYDQLKGLATAQWLLPKLLSMTGADTMEETQNYVYRAVGEKRTELRAMYKTDGSRTLNATQTTFFLDNNCDVTTFTINNYRTKAININSTSHITDLLLLSLNGNPTSYFDSNMMAGVYGDIKLYDGETGNDTTNYLQGTETILPYFYLVARDNLLNATNKTDMANVTPADYYNLLRHTLSDPDKELYSNEMTITNNNTIDFLDLEYLFKTYIPYLHAMQEQSKTKYGPQKIGAEYTLYSEEPTAFLFECNWADKILNAYDFGDDAKPSTYMDRYGREMIFSRAQLKALQDAQESAGYTPITVKDLTEVELRCIEINDEVDKQWTLLINYIANDGVTIDILAEQMALTATVAFNSIMSKDRVINNNYALYPNAVSLRTINFDTMLKLVLMSNFGLADTNQNSMRIVLAESGLLTGIVLWLLALLVTHVVPFITGLSMAVVFYASIFSCIYNAAVDGKDKLKTCGGAAVTCLAIAAETCAYVYSYALIIGNTHKVLSVDKIEAGTTVATGKVFAIFLITIFYLILLVFQAWKNAVNFRDMGAQMWMSYSKKSYDAVTTFFKNFASKVKGAIKHTDPTAKAVQSAMEGVEVNTKIDDEVRVTNSASDPLFTKDTNSADEATYIWTGDDEADNSGYILNPHHRDASSAVEDKKDSKEEAKSDSDKKEEA